MTYDPNERRDTTLAQKLKERIRREGPISIAEYMRACLQDPEHGYYRKAAAIGAKGDFITAPEISQVFGELIGLWFAVVWQQMGRPDRVNLVELGPGRGTMMADALRAAATVPGFRSAVSLAFVENNHYLRAIQAETLRPLSIEPRYIGREDDAWPTNGPSIFVANEYLDCIPIHQHVLTETDCGRGWHEKMVEAGEGDVLRIGINPERQQFWCPDVPHELLSSAKPGDIFEHVSFYDDIVHMIDQDETRGRPVVALMIDYGHMKSGFGETLQAVRGHRWVDPLFEPGGSDLTAHVDFAALARAFHRWNSYCSPPSLAVDGPITQAEFLGRLSIVERASKLMAANPAKVAEIEAGVARLIAPNGMGTRFKAIGVRSAGLPVLPGFE